MPAKRVPALDIEGEVAELEKANRIVSLVAAGPGAYVVVYEPKRGSGAKETR